MEVILIPILKNTLTILHCKDAGDACLLIQFIPAEISTKEALRGGFAEGAGILLNQQE